MKKAQLKIQQTAFMLLAVTLFFILVGISILAFKFSDIKKSANQLEEENAMLLASKIANSPEFSCGEAFGGARINCVDADKVMMLKNNENYNDFWKVSNIEIRKILPSYEKDIACEIENYPECNIIIIKQKEGNSGFDASNFVSLCRKESDGNSVYNKCEIAKIMVRYENK